MKNEVDLLATLPNSLVVWFLFLYPLYKASCNYVSLLTVTQVAFAIVGPSQALSNIYN